MKFFSWKTQIESKSNFILFKYHWKYQKKYSSCDGSQILQKCFFRGAVVDSTVLRRLLFHILPLMLFFVNSEKSADVRNNGPCIFRISFIFSTRMNEFQYLSTMTIMHTKQYHYQTITHAYCSIKWRVGIWERVPSRQYAIAELSSFVNVSMLHFQLWNQSLKTSRLEFHFIISVQIRIVDLHNR